MTVESINETTFTTFCQISLKINKISFVRPEIILFKFIS